MKHKYIDLSILYDTSKPVTRKDVVLDFDKYGITNIKFQGMHGLYFEYCIYRDNLVDALYMDYMKRGLNYHAYIEEGMDARLMMELRTCALIRLADDMAYYYAAYGDCDTVEEVRKLRLECVSEWDSNYRDFDWQTYMLVRICWAKRSYDILIDYESCFADGDPDIEGNPEIYRRQFLEQNIPKERIISREWTGRVQENIDWDKYYEGIEP